ncbi:MAG: HlyC/CorC family transporter [Oscillospiraceae bacterium]|nr:HlyC/CorC family transporter [Oscillospiraceae bacterium]
MIEIIEMDYLVYIAAILLFWCGSAFFSASEMAMSSANRLRMENAAEEGSSAARAACKVLDNYEDTLSAILIGNNLCNIASDSLVTVVVTALVGSWFTPISTVLVVLILIFFCESAPKIVAKKNANRFTMRIAPLLRGLTILLMPVIRLVGLLIRLLTFAMKGEQRQSGDEEAAAELQSILETVEDEGVIDEERSELLRSALDFSETAVMDVMTARVDVLAVNVEDSLEEILDEISDEPYTRIPVYEDSLDNVVGVLYLNHLFRALLDEERPDIRSLLLPVSYVYKTVKLPDVLRQLRNNQQHLAVVTDEYGGTLGIVTLEDVLEEIVGDIWDETDEVERDVIERPDGTLEMDGGLPVADFLDFLELPDNALDTESYTLGGWTIEEFGSFPKAGDSFQWREFTITVLEMDEDGRRVEKVLARKAEENEE